MRLLDSAYPAMARQLAANLAFRVMREGRDIGSHTVRFRDDGALLRARTEMRIEVKLMGFTVFRLTQDTEEAWRGAAQRTVDDAEMKYVVVHLHRLLEPDSEAVSVPAAESVQAER